MKKRNFSVSVFLLLGIFFPFFTFATWSGDPYSQGETLNPECSPTDENCTVSIPEAGNLFSQDGITYIGTLADTIDPPVSINIQTVPDNSGYEQPNPGYPHTHSYRVYSYRNEGDSRVYSQTYAQEYLTIASDDVGGNYDVNVTWDAVPGADGYRVFGSNPVPYDEHNLGTSFHYYQDIEGTELTDTSNIEDWSEGSDVFPNGIPFAVNEALGTVGIGMLPSENYALSVSGDTLTNGSIIFGNPNNDTAGIHYGPTGLYGQAQNWTPNPDGMNGLWIEGSNGEEGGGFYADGDMAAIWSAGDVDLLRIYDEDALSTNRAAMVFDHEGFLRSDSGLVGVNDSMTVDGVLSVGILNNGNENDDYLGIQNQAMVNVMQPSNTPVEQLVDGDFEGGTWNWDYSSSWFIDSGAYFTFNSEDTSRTIKQYYNDQDFHPIEGDTYDVSIDVGGDTGSISLCLGQRGSDTGCEIINAGSGTTSHTLAWHPDGPEEDNNNTIINIQATEDFNGYIDNISVMSRPKNGLAFISSAYPVAVSLGLDAGEITDATGFKITTSDPGSTKSASFFLEGEDDSHYGYVLPSLTDIEGGIDTFCMQDLGNCSSAGVESLSTEERDNLESPNNNQVIFNTTTKTMQYYTEASGYSVYTAEGGSAAHAEQAMGETFTPQVNSGILKRITGTFAARYPNDEVDGLKANVIAKIYDAPNGNLLATSDNVVTDSSVTDELSSPVTGVWTFDDAELTLTASTQYYVEFSDTDSIKNALYFNEVGGDQYDIGQAYGGAPQDVETLTSGYDLAFFLEYGTTEGSWTDVSTGTTPTWNTNTNGIDYTDGKVGVGTTTPKAAIDVVGGGDGVGFSQIARYHDVETWVVSEEVSGDMLYSSDGYHLDIFDISNPTTEHLLTYFDFYQFGVTPNVVKVVGDMAYVGAGQSVYVLDIRYVAQGQTPVLLGAFEGWNTAKDLQVRNGVLYVVDSGYDFYTLDVSSITPTNPGNPELMTDGAYETYYNPMKIALSDNGRYVYISEDDDMVQVYEVSDPYNPEWMSNYQNGEGYFSGGIATKGKYVYATRDTNDGESFVVLDASDPENLVQVGSADIGQYRYNTHVVLNGNIAYIADGQEDSVYAINVSYPANPIIIGHGTTDGNSLGIAVYKDKLFVADGGNSIVVLSAPINYAALFNNGNVGIGTNDPAFNLDVGAKSASATLTLTSVSDLAGDGFVLKSSDEGVGFGGYMPFEFVNDGSGGMFAPISTVINYPDNTDPVTLSQLIDRTVTAINSSDAFTATRVGNDIKITQAAAGDAGNQINELMNDANDPVIHPTHTSSSGHIILTDFTGGMNGDINFGGNLYQHGQLFTGSQWSDSMGGISYVGGVYMSAGDVSIGDGSFLYDNETGITSIDNLSLGALTFPEDAGAVSWIDLPISGNGTEGTIESYTASIGGLDILTVHAEDDGVGGLQNTGVRLDNLPTGSMNATSYLCIDSNNEIVAGNDFDGCDVSSIRFKQNVNALTDDNGLAEVMKLNPVSFFYKPEFNGALQTNANFSGEQLGFIAEEVQQVDPRLIVLEADGTTPHGVRYEKITAILAKAVKEIGNILTGFKDKFSTKKLCVGDTCVTETEFLQMIQSAGATPVSNDQTPPSEETPAPDENQTPDQTETPAPDQSTDTSSDQTPAPEETPTPDQSTDAASDQAPIPTPDQTPAPDSGTQ